MRRFILVLALLLALTTTASFAVTPQFHYQGQLRVSSSAYTGTADFYFAILTKQGGETILWVNDGGDLGTLPPSSAVNLPVANGVFETTIGDPTIANMSAISPTVFSTDENLYLRVWVNAGAGIQQLNPDNRILLNRVIGNETEADLTIYVNSSTGDDRYLGILPARPKATIQNAIDSLPSILRGNTVIQLQDGTYNESVIVKNVILAGSLSSFTIQGNTTTPANVIIAGASPADGITIDGTPQKITIKGITVQGFDEGIRIDKGRADLTDMVVSTNTIGVRTFQSYTVLSNVSVTQNQIGLVPRDQSTMNISTSAISNNTLYGMLIVNSSVQINGGTVNDNTDAGLRALQNSSLEIIGGTQIVRSGKTGSSFRAGIYADTMATVRLSNVTIDDCPTAISAKQNAYIFFNNTGVVLKNSTDYAVRLSSRSTLEWHGGSVPTFTSNSPSNTFTELGGTIYQP